MDNRMENPRVSMFISAILPAVIVSLGVLWFTGVSNYETLNFVSAYVEQLRGMHR